MPTIIVKIEFDPQTGALKIDAPLQNKVLCYGILEAAKAAIKDHDLEKQAGIVVPHIRFPMAKNGE